MKHLSGKKGQLSPDDRTTVATNIVRFCRELYPVKWTECVAADLNVSVDTVSKWEERQSVPSGMLIRRMITRYGTAFLRAYLPAAPAWLDLAQQQEREREIRAQLDELERELKSIRG